MNLLFVFRTRLCTSDRNGKKLRKYNESIFALNSALALNTFTKTMTTSTSVLNDRVINETLDWKDLKYN